MPQGKRYYIIEQRGLPVDVTANWARAQELQAQYNSRMLPATIVEVEALQQELPLESKKPFCVNENYEVGSGRRCECGTCEY